MKYDYKKGKDDIQEILNNATQLEDKIIPKDDSNFTYGNGIKSWVGSIFVDIIDSTDLIQNTNELQVAKILRAFSSEIITIMNNSDNVRQIGIRGDCVYGVFISPTKEDTYELADIAFYINTLISMLNKLFQKKGYKTIAVGIGVAIGDHKDLIIKAGKKGTGINDRIWIGKAVVDACNLANKAGRDGRKTIGFSKNTYDNLIDILIDKNKDKDVKNWFYYDKYTNAYYANVIKVEFDNWIDENL